MSDKHLNFEKFLTVKEASQLLGVSGTTIRNWDRDGKVKAIRHPINNYRLYDSSELKKILKDTHLGASKKPSYIRRSIKKDHQKNKGLLKIIIVEDNLRDIELLNRALNENGFNGPTTVLRDGEMAINYFSTTKILKFPTIVLLDLKLPKVEGIEVLRFLKSNPDTRSVPVVALTTCSSDNDIVNGYNLGVSGYILKEVDFNEFVSSIDSLLKYWSNTNKLPSFSKEQL